MAARRRRGPSGGAAPASDALVTRLFDYGETSAVAVLLTEDRGAVHAVAKGAKRLENSFQGPLDMGVLYRVRLGRRGREGLFHLHSSRVREPFARVRLDPERFLAAALVLEVAHDLMREGEPNRELFRLATFTLKALDRAPPGRVPLAITLFLARAVALSGHEPETERCLGCGRPANDLARLVLSPARGGVLHPRCAQPDASARPVHRQSLEILRDMRELPAAEVLARPWPPDPLRSLRLSLAAWLEHSLERGFRALGPMEREFRGVPR